MSDRLHCDVNELVNKWLEREGADLAELAGRVTVMSDDSNVWSYCVELSG